MYEQLDLFNMEPVSDEKNYKHFIPFILYGSNTDDCREQVIDAFQKGISIEAIARLLKQLYHGYNGINGWSARYDDNGITINYGKTVVGSNTISWLQVANLIKELIEQHQYGTKKQFETARNKCMTNTAWKVCYMLGDCSLKTQFYDKHVRCCFPQCVANVVNIMNDNPEQLEDFMYDLCDSYSQNKDIMRFKFHAPDKTIKHVMYSLMPYIHEYSSDVDEYEPYDSFIPKDEVIASITRCGSSVSDWEKRIRSFFKEHKDMKERVQFLKNEYGIGGRSHALSNSNHSSESHDSKGIKFEKQNCQSVFLTYNEVSQILENYFNSKKEDD